MLELVREVLPGDGSFGDSMSTSGTSPTQALGRRARTLQESRFSLLGEVILAASSRSVRSSHRYVTHSRTERERVWPC
jgi:hypothetical protein